MRPWCTIMCPPRTTIPWMEILFYLAMLGCTGFLLFSMMRGGAGGGGIMNVGKAKVKDEHENKKHCHLCRCGR